MVTQFDRSKLNRVLQRESQRVARAATETLLPYMERALMPVRASNARGGLEGRASISTDPDEMALMMEDGFRRLGALVGFSVLVDEPGLIADDLIWLRDMLGGRGVRKLSHGWLENMMHVYVGACANVLDEEELRMVRETTERALALLHEREGV
jgi:hypothetical protein